VKAWGKPALEIKGNFTWGLINQQKDEDSEEETKRMNNRGGPGPGRGGGRPGGPDGPRGPRGGGPRHQVSETDSSEKPNMLDIPQTLGSKITLKSVDLQIEANEFVCIIGEIGSGKSSLLNSIFGEMVFVSDEQLSEFGSMDSQFKAEEFIQMQKEIVKTAIVKPPVIRRGTVSYVE